MNVWIINHYAIAPNQPGGTRHFTLARELVRQGHDVTIIASNLDYQTRQAKLNASSTGFTVEMVEGVRFVWLDTALYKSNGIRRVWNMLDFARRIWFTKSLWNTPMPDVVVGSSPQPFAALAAALLAQQMGKPFVLEVRDLWPKTLIDLGAMSAWHPFILLLAAIEKYLYQKAVRIVTLLPMAGSYMVTRGATPEKIVVIPNGIDPDSIGTPPPPIEQESFTILYAGAHGVANDLETALNAAEYLQAESASHPRQIRLRFIGDGPRKEALIRLASEKGLTNVSFDPPVSKREIYGIMAEADAFLMPLVDSPTFKWSVSPNKLFDYLASARPVIFAITSPNNPVEAAQAGVTVPPSNGRALAEAIKALAMTPLSERIKMGNRGRFYVLEHHTFSILGKRFEEVLRDACALKAA